MKKARKGTEVLFWKAVANLEVRFSVTQCNRLYPKPLVLKPGLNILYRPEDSFLS